MEDTQLNKEQTAILQQYKEILNESDDDMARATLESLGWDLQKAIEASSVTDNGMTSVAPGINGVQGSFPQYESMDADNASVEIIDESSNDDDQIFARLNPKVKLEDSIKPMVIDSKPSSSSSFIYKQSSKNRRTAQTDADLSLDCYITNDSSNGVSRKMSGERNDSGSGSVCSLSGNPAQASTSAMADLMVIGSGAAGSSSTADKESRKEKKRCKMSDNEKKEVISFESEESDQEDVEEMDDSIAYLTDEDTKKEDSPNVSFNDQIPLIPTDFSSILEAMQNFTSVFEARYGGNFAPFFQGSLQEALAEAFDASGRGAVVRSAMERRPLAIYLHSDTSIASNIFAQNVMCSESVSSLLKCQFVTWAWDMSQNENRKKLYEWLAASNMTDVCQNIKTIHRSKYPLLVVLMKDRLNIYPFTVIKGHDGASQAVEKLMQGLDMYLRIKNKDVAEEQSRLEREQIRQEQVEEYEKSLATDRAKQEELAKQRQREREEELQKQMLEEQKMMRRAELASTLPAEPSESESDVITIRIRFPTGEQKIRRFRVGESVNWLVVFVESIGFTMEEHRIWTSDMPKKDLTAFNLSKTFTELNWPRREQVTVEEK